MRILLIMLLVVVAGTGFCADGQNVAVLNMREIMSAHPEMAQVESVIEKKLEEFNAEKADYQMQVEKMKKDLEEAFEASESNALSDEAKKIKKAQVEERLVELKQFQLKTKESLKMRRDQIEDQSIRMQKNIVDKISAVVAEYAKKNEITMVMNNQVVVYHDEAKDITDKVMELIIKESKSK